MKINGLVQNSFLDWDGKLVAVVFLGGCNFRCGYCHARDLLSPNRLPDVPLQALEDLVRRQRGWLDGIVVSGGEPTIHPDLPHFLSRLKRLGALIKLDTNGSNPEMIRQVLEADLVDYVAMDVKAPLASSGEGPAVSRGGKKGLMYQHVVGRAIDMEDIKKTIQLLIESGLEHEFRTTVVPPLLSGDDIVAIAKDLRGAKRYVLQQFKPAYALEPALRKAEPYGSDELREIASISRKYVPRCLVRGEQPSIAFPVSPQGIPQPATGSAIPVLDPQPVAAPKA